MSNPGILLIAILAMISIGLTGCASGLSGETVVGLTGSPMWLKTASQATQTAHFSAICRGYGFKDGTTEMSHCLQTETVSAKARAQKTISDDEIRSALSRPKSLTCTSIGNKTSLCN